MFSITQLLILICCSYATIDCANILGVFPIPSKSHHILGVELLKGFAKHGHNVTLVSAYGVNESIQNFTMIEVKGLAQYKEENMRHMFHANTSMFEKFRRGRGSFGTIIELFFESEEIQTLISSEDTKFDLVINFMLFHEIFSIFGHIFDVPIIGYVPTSGLTHATGLLGNPSPLAYVPHVFLPFNEEMSFWQRVANTLLHLLWPIFKYVQVQITEADVLERLFPTAPPIEEMMERMDMIFINTHISHEPSRPYLPNVIQIGGHHLQEPQHLPEKLKNFLDESVDGVVYFSFGTNVKSAEQPQEVRDAFIEKFSQLKMKVLWKFEENTLPGKPDNVKLEKWLPQRAVLDHPNVKLFITHGGAGGTMEALYYGVPTLCIPFFADQAQNCAQAANNGFSVTLQFNDITKETFSNAIDEMLSNSKYAENMKLRSDLYRNQAINPMKTAIFWAEHVIKYKGAKHLKSIAAKIPLYQYLLLDVVMFLFAAVLIILSCIYFSSKFVIRKIFRKNRKTKSE